VSETRFIHRAVAFDKAAGYDGYLVLCSCGALMGETALRTHIVDANKNWKDAL
jgi:hypothetical protein